MVRHSSEEEKMKVAFHTLGCKVNQYETEAIREEFEKNGFETVKEDEYADVYVVNTCTVTNQADRKSRQYIRRMKKVNPSSVMIATGCYVQMDSEELLKLDEIDLLIGNNLKSLIYEKTMELLSGRYMDNPYILPYEKLSTYEDMGMVTSIEARTRAYIKIQEGCNRFCSYCIIPYARGQVRSRNIEEIELEAKLLIDKGFKEIVLTGINTALYGVEFGETIELAVKTVCELPGDFRVRLSSLEPTVVDIKGVNNLLKYDKLCHHLHLSLQSGSNDVLKKMNRKYTKEEYLAIVKILREFDPCYNITTDIIVGFPGETDEDFEDSLDMVRKACFGKVHGFKFSSRHGTKASLMKNTIDGRMKNIRIDNLLNLSEQVASEFRENNLGRITGVLFEEYEEGLLAGYTENYIKVYVKGEEKLLASINKVKLVDKYKDGCFGEIAEKG